MWIQNFGSVVCRKNNYIKRKLYDGYVLWADNYKYLIPLATVEQTRKLEDFIFVACYPSVDCLEKLDDKKLKLFLQNAMLYDEERGLGLYKIPKLIHEHNEWFEKFEKRLWIQIDKRRQNVSDDFWVYSWPQYKKEQ